VHSWNYEIEGVYNLKRLHSSIGHVLVDEFEYNVLKLKPDDRPALNVLENSSNHGANSNQSTVAT